MGTDNYRSYSAYYGKSRLNYDTNFVSKTDIAESSHYLFIYNYLLCIYVEMYLEARHVSCNTKVPFIVCSEFQ